jgi:hypothetical protein
MVRHAVLALAILLAALVAAQGAQAQGAGRGLVPMPPVAHPGNPHPGNHHPFQHHGFKGRPFMPYWGIGVYAPPVTYLSYASYEPAPVYEPVPVYSQPSMELGLPPIPSVIPYPNGRYVLVGDGLTSSYRWVWIPNPPSAPPATPPEKSPAPSAPGPAGPAASRGSPLYRWVDDEDVVHFTQGWDAVPERYRAQVKLAGVP